MRENGGGDMIRSLIEMMRKSGAEQAEARFQSALGYMIHVEVEKMEEEDENEIQKD